jgi:hypothetical protein
MATNNAINSLNPIQVALGGTGAATLTTHGVLLGEGTGAITALAAAATGATLMGSTGADPAFTGSPSFSGSVTAGTSITATSGDLTITAGNILLPTTSSSVGNIKFNNVVYAHAFGTNNIFLGNLAGNYTTTGLGQNVAVGTSCLSILTGGVLNTAVGFQALKGVTSGTNNVGLGNNAGLVISTSSENIAIGDGTLTALTTGTGNNVAVGGAAGGQITTGANNVFVGITAGFNLTGSDGQNIMIGQCRGTAGDNTKIRIGFSTTNAALITKTFIDGIRGTTTTNIDALAVLIDSAGQLGTISSSIRFKENVQDMADDSSPIMELRPVTFNYKTHPGKKSFGLIAEEVLPIMPELVAYNIDGEVESVKYHDIAVMLLNEVQKLNKRIDELENK